MKILIASPMPPQPQAPGAIPLVLHAQLMGLHPRHEITIVTVAGQEPGELDALDRLAASGVNIQAVRRCDPQGFQRWQRRWRFASAWMGGFYPWRTIWFWEPEIQCMLDRLLAGDRYDLVIAEDNSMGVYAFRTRKPVIFTEHEVRTPRRVNWRGLQKANALRWALSEADWARWERYQRRVWSRFDRIQVFTQRDAEEVLKLAPSLAPRVRVNPFGITTPKAVHPGCETPGQLLFVGNFTHPPNIDAALWLGREIMPLLRARCTGLRLSIVGNSPPREVCELACEDIRVTGRVMEIEPYFEQAAVVLAPLRIGGGMRMKVLQAMAMGKAVVTTPRGIEGLAFDGSRPPVITAGSTWEIAQAAASLLEHEDTRHELGRRARAFAAEHFSPQAYALRLEAIYSELQAGLSRKDLQ